MSRRAKPQPTPAKRKAGRPKKAAAPKAAAGPPPSIADAMQAELLRVRQRAAGGARLANHESRILRDAWLLDQALHLWAGLEAAAADLGISPSTLRSYAGEGCPGLEPHSPIPKAPVLAWLLKNSHDRGGSGHATQHSIEAVDLSIKQAKEAKIWGSLIAEAEDRASQGVIETIDSLKHALLQVIPAQLADLCRDAADRVAAEDAARDLIENALRACRYAPPAAIVSTTHQPENIP